MFNYEHKSAVEMSTRVRINFLPVLMQQLPFKNKIFSSMEGNIPDGTRLTARAYL